MPTRSHRCLRLAAALLIASVPSVASAHFLWVAVGDGTQDGKVHVYFSESAAPDDPSLLERVKSVEVWSAVHKMRDVTFTPLKVALKDDSLVGELPAGAATVGLTHTYGVISRGGQTFLLAYSAKAYPASTPSAWPKIDNAKKLPLEIVPRWQGNGIEAIVLWKGRPAAGAEVVASGAGIDELKVTADDAGRVRIEPKADGLLSVRARHVLEEKGEHDGTAYAEIRHYGTLALPVRLPQRISVANNLPDLPRGTTSFGGAIVGDWLYVYGGHLGGAHHYSSEEQSGDFARVNLAKPGEWEKLPGGPKRTGLAMVASNGSIYRIGGFVATNKEGEDQNLESTNDAARFDVSTKTWTDLPPLPEGRSSFDAAVLDGKLYAAGGWRLNGKEESVWHDTALVCDLNESSPKWTEIKVPFRRRAVSVAAHEGRIYVIGGMQEKGGTTTRVDVYNPATNEWTEGPSLIGSPLDGFGTSSFAAGGRLYATNMSGSLQQLSEDGKSWKIVGQLDHPRFFHRLLPKDDGSLIAVGGASMMTGKTLEVEVLSERGH